MSKNSTFRAHVVLHLIVGLVLFLPLILCKYSCAVCFEWQVNCETRVYCETRCQLIVGDSKGIGFFCRLFFIFLPTLQFLFLRITSVLQFVLFYHWLMEVLSLLLSIMYYVISDYLGSYCPSTILHIMRIGVIWCIICIIWCLICIIYLIIHGAWLMYHVLTLLSFWQVAKIIFLEHSVEKPNFIGYHHICLPLIY